MNPYKAFEKGRPLQKNSEGDWRNFLPVTFNANWSVFLPKYCITKYCMNFLLEKGPCLTDIVILLLHCYLRWILLDEYEYHFCHVSKLSNAPTLSVCSFGRDVWKWEQVEAVPLHIFCMIFNGFEMKTSCTGPAKVWSNHSQKQSA